MKPADMLDIAAAVEAVHVSLTPEERFDLRQELAIKLLERGTPPDSVRAWARQCAINWAQNHVKAETAHRAILRELAAPGPHRGYRKGANWSPTWYPACAGAKEFAPFACEGARLIMPKSGGHGGADVEQAMADALDARGVWKKNRHGACK